MFCKFIYMQSHCLIMQQNQGSNEGALPPLIVKNLKIIFNAETMCFRCTHSHTINSTDSTCY